MGGRTGGGGAGARSVRVPPVTPGPAGWWSENLEARDWASGTSSRSSNLIHGGLRYLEMLDFRLVREALKERGLLLQRLAPSIRKDSLVGAALDHRLHRHRLVTRQGAPCGQQS